MQHKRLGSSGLDVSRIALGDDELRVTFFDTADMYSSGVSEEITGRLLAKLFTNRDDYVLATKVCSVRQEGDQRRAVDVLEDRVVRDKRHAEVHRGGGDPPVCVLVLLAEPMARLDAPATGRDVLRDDTTTWAHRLDGSIRTTSERWRCSRAFDALNRVGLSPN